MKVPLAKFTLRLTIGFCLALVAGCNVQLPRFQNPGHLYSQRLQSTYHDPYENVYAAPGFDGGRPREYQQPRAEPVQSQWYY